VIVAGDRDDAAVPRRAGRVAVLERVARAVDAAVVEEFDFPPTRARTESLAEV